MPITGIDAAAKASHDIVGNVHHRLSNTNPEFNEDEDLSDSAVVIDSNVLHGDALPVMFALGAQSGANVVVHVAVLDKKRIVSLSESGLSILHSSSTQEAYDMSICAHAFAAHGLGPVFHAIDSARTSFSFVAPMNFVHDAKAWVQHETHLSDDHTADGKYRAVDEMEQIFTEFGKKTKRNYSVFEYFGSAEANRVVVTSGSTARTCMDWLRRFGTGEKLGVVNVRVSRPWSASHFLRVLPTSVVEVCATPEVFAEAAASFHHEAAQSRENDPPLFKHGLVHVVTSLEEAAGLFGVREEVESHPWLREKTSSSLVKEIVCTSASASFRGPVLAEVLGAHVGLKVQEYDARHEKNGLVRKELRFSPIDISYSQYPITRADVLCIESISQCESMLANHLGKQTVVIINSSGLDLNRELSSGVKTALEASNAHVFALDVDGLLRKVQGTYESFFPFVMLASALHFCSDVTSYTQAHVHLAKKIQEIFNHSEPSRVLCKELTDSTLSSGTWLKRVQITTTHGSPARAVVAQDEERFYHPLELVAPIKKAPVPDLDDTLYHRLLSQLFRDRFVVSDPKDNLETAFGQFLTWSHAEKHARSRWIVTSAARLTDLQSIHLILSSQEPVNVMLLCHSPDSVASRDVGLYAMNYGTAYVASIAADASHAQAVKALTEAEARKGKGPSIVLAFLGSKADVDSGAWPLYRWNPALQEDGSGSDPFTLDSAKLKSDVHEFLKRDQHLSLIARRTPVVNPSLTRSAESELDKKGQSAAARANEKKLAASFSALRSGLSQGTATVNLNLLILYGSDGGNAASVAETLARKAELSGCGETRCQEANEFKLEDLENEAHVVFVLATAGQGEDCANAKRLTADLLASKAKLPKLKYAVFGMGDSAYWGEGSADSAKYFCLPARRLHDKLKDLSAHPMVHVGLGDDQNDDGYDGALAEWEPALWKALGVKVVQGNLGGAPPVVDDEIKIQSNYLRGTISEGLADLSTGKLVFEDTKITKFHGIYQQDDRDVRENLDAKGVERAYSFMIRIGVPGGVATAKQYLDMEELCEKYASGRLKITTRQAYQFHGIVKKNLKTTMQGINRACMDTLAACGDVNRNIIANPRHHDGEVYEAVTQLARAINAHLRPKTSAYHEIWLDKKPVAGFKDHEPLYGATYLPRKFKVAIAVPPENDVDVFAHCAGFIAIVQNGRLMGYNVCAGGGLGTTHGDKNTYPRLSDVLGFCLPEQAVKVVEAIMIVQRDHGERLNRKHARLKYTMEDHGYQWYRERVEEHCGFKLQEARPFKFESNADNYGWRRGERTGLWTYTMFVESGYIHDEHPQYKLKSALHEIAQLLTAFDGEMTLTANQNIIMGAIPDSQKPNVMRLLAKWGVDNEHYSAMRLHSMACVALPTCALAMAESQRYLPSLITKLEQTLDQVGLRHDAITIRMTGCPNGCARPYLAEIAFIGKAPGVYNLHLGGGFAGNRLNRIYREGVNEEQILGILQPLLIRYAKERKSGERFGDFLIRVKVIMPVYHGHSFWAKDDTENDTTSRSGTVQIYW